MESNKPTTLSSLFCIGFSTPETKLFILFWYYISVFLVILTFCTVKIQAVNSTFENLEAYFRCSLAGYKPECDVYKEKAEDVSQSTYFLDILTYLMACTLNVSNLTYSLQFYDIKLFIKKKLYSSKA